MHVTGSGNFDRVDSAMLDRVDQWKTYPPKSSFKPSDTVGFKGEKIFEQPLIASQAGAQTLPGLAFSYFDPSSRRYETARSAPLSVKISPSLADSSLSAPPGPATATSPQTPGSPSNRGLRPDHLAANARSGSSSLVPLYLRPRFLAIPSLLALGFAGAFFSLRRASDPADRRRVRERGLSKASSRVLKELEAAAHAGDAALFFSRARTELLRTLAARWPVAPDRMTPAELDTKLGAESEEIRELFALADEANYSGHVLTTTDFERWMQIMRHRLTDEKPS
jgi:hypothetical protein